MQKIGQWLVKNRLKLFMQPIEKTQQFASGRLDGPAAVGVSNTGHQAHKKTPPYMAGPPSGVLGLAVWQGVCGQPDRAIRFSRLSHPHR